MKKIKILANVCILIALYYLTYYLYAGILNPIPALGDSWDYHIPIAKTILNGSFLHLTNAGIPQWYYPGSSEAINSLLMFLNIPLTLSNILAIVVLFFCLVKLGKTFKLDFYFRLIFASSFITLNAVLRWSNAVSIDIWLAVFFCLALILLENPKKSLSYFAKLGFILGMLIGSKYTACLFMLILGIFYSKKIIQILSLKRFISFLLPFSFFGLFWYIRNYLLTANPFYPLTVLNFKGVDLFGGLNVWNVSLKYPIVMLNSFFGEYKLWSFVLLLAVGWLIYQFIVKKNFALDSINKLFALGLLNFLLYFSFPTSEEPWIMVSSLRYSFPAFIPMFLGVFLLAKRYKKEELIGYVTVGNMIMVTSLAYYPKLVLIYMPIAIGVFYLLSKHNPNLTQK